MIGRGPLFSSVAAAVSAIVCAPRMRSGEFRSRRSGGQPVTASSRGWHKARVSSGGIHHVFITIKDLERSRPFYAQLMPRLGYPGTWDFGGDGLSLGFLGAGGSFWIKQGDPRFAGDTF